MIQSDEKTLNRLLRDIPGTERAESSLGVRVVCSAGCGNRAECVRPDAARVDLLAGQLKALGWLPARDVGGDYVGAYCPECLPELVGPLEQAVLELLTPVGHKEDLRQHPGPEDYAAAVALMAGRVDDIGSEVLHTPDDIINALAGMARVLDDLGETS